MGTIFVISKHSRWIQGGPPWCPMVKKSIAKEPFKMAKMKRSALLDALYIFVPACSNSLSASKYTIILSSRFSTAST